MIRTTLSTLAAVFFIGLVMGQDTIGIMATPHIKAKFPGGESAMECYLDTTLKSNIVSVPSVKGYLFIRYQIDTEGKVIDINLMKHISAAVDSEIVRAFTQMPLWSPAMHNGKKVFHYQSYSLKLPYQRKSCGLPPTKK